jgi:hypothetical protein
MLGDRRLTDSPEIPMQTSKMLSALRYVRQLAMDDAAMFAASDPSMAAFGIRASVWDNRQAPEATGLALLTVCNTLESLESIRTRQPAPPAR